MPRLRPHAIAPTSSASPPPDAEADDALLVRAAQGTPNAFAFLYDRYVDRIHRYCYLKLGNRDAAEDATSQVFLEALAELGHFRGGSFAGWLFRIAQHTVTDVYRARRLARSIDEVGSLMDSAPLPEQSAIARSDLDTLRAALETLPTDQRLVMELQLADLSTQEIADALGKSANAIRIIRYRAFQQLRSILGPHPVEATGGGA